MPHSYEEVRGAVLDILSGREKCAYEASQYEHVKIGVAEVFDRRDSAGKHDGRRRISEPRLDVSDSESFREVFWDLFRQGIITLGLNDSNPAYPFFRVSSFGRRVLEGQSPYFFHDVSTYTKMVKDQVPEIDEVTLLYLQEAVQAFKAGCILSSSVMLGVATEHTFGILLETIEASPAHAATYAAVRKERSFLPRFNRFRQILDGRAAELPPDVKEDLDTQFAGILSIIRTFRNESGHPSGKILDREQAYVLLQLFIPYSRKLYQLIRHFRGD